MATLTASRITRTTGKTGRFYDITDPATGQSQRYRA